MIPQRTVSLFMRGIVLDNRRKGDAHTHMPDIAFEQTAHPDRADADAVDAGLHRSNRAAADYSTLRELACFARLPSGALAGGAMARTWGRCCELQQLWVDEPYRRQGIGSRLIEMVER